MALVGQSHLQGKRTAVLFIVSLPCDIHMTSCETHHRREEEDGLLHLSLQVVVMETVVSQATWKCMQDS